MMNLTEPLPAFLRERYHRWREGGYADRAGEFDRLMREGQSPTAMIIGCCDSRVGEQSLFGLEPGDAFVHRNIAALVPPHDPEADHHGTAAAIEYGVAALGVAHLIVLGHSSCGGVAGCHAMCRGEEVLAGSTYLRPWLEMLRPGVERIGAEADAPGDLRHLEQEAVRLSVENLGTYPFVEAATSAGRLAVHGLWIDIAPGRLWRVTAEGAEEI